MRINFRQGIVQYTQPIPIQVSFPYISLLASKESPFVANIAHGTTNYLYAEKQNAANAWGPISVGADVWLYMDIDKRTARRTFGSTLLEPVHGSVAPLQPANNQHWFDTTVNLMKVWNGTSWIEKIRIFVCMLQGGKVPISMSILSPDFSGTQIGDTSEVIVGYILYDDNSYPIKAGDGTFLTSEDNIKVSSLSNSDVKLASLLIEATAQQTMPAFTIVEFTEFGVIKPASSFVTQQTKQYGIIQQGVIIGERVPVLTDGQITNLDWDWTSVGVNTPLYNDSNGALSAIPSIPQQQPVAIVVDVNTITIAPKVIIATLPPKVAEDDVVGVSRLSVPAIDPQDPIAVGDNDPRLLPYVHSSTHPSTMITTPTHGILTDPTLDLQLAQLADRNIDSLQDVTVTSPIIGQALTFDGASWINSTPATTMDSLTDVVIATPVSGQAITFDGTNWINSTPATTMDSLTDVVLTTPVSGQAITFDGANWINSTPSTTMDSLTDVVIAAPVSGQAITFDGTNWVNSTPSATSSLVELTDVAISTPEVGQTLIYGGSNWINRPTPLGILSYGNNSYGEIGNNTTTAVSIPTRESTNRTDWNSMGAGFNNVAAITKSGNLWTWGANNNGQIGDGTTTWRSSPVQIGLLTDWAKISIGVSGGDFFYAIKTDGTLWSWGRNNYGQLGDGTDINKSSPIQIGTSTNWKTVATAFGSAHAIKTDGSLWACGYDSYGHLGMGTFHQNLSTLTRVGNLGDWSEISCAYGAFMAIKTDGTLWSCGYNGRGQLGDGTTSHKSSPIQIGALTDWKTVQSGGNHSLSIKTDGTLWGWGQNNSGQLGDGTSVNKSSPIQIGLLTDWADISCGYSHSVAIRTDGTMWAWGNSVLSPVQVQSSAGWKKVVSTAYNWHGIIDADTIPPIVYVSSVSGSSSVSGLSLSGGPIKTSGTLTLSGTLGIAGGGTGQTTATNALTALLPSQSGQSGKYLTSNGTSASWGTVAAGGAGGAVLPVTNELSTINAGNPTKMLVTDGTTESWIPFSYTAPNNSVWMAGKNNTYQLGDGTITNRLTLFNNPTTNNWVSIGHGGGHTVAVKADGTLWAWGSNSFGELGDSTVTNVTTPIQIGALTDWKFVSTGGHFTAAIKQNGSLWTWGYNADGQLGDNTRTSRSSPVQVGALVDWSTISCGYNHIIAVKTNKTLWSWGNNVNGQLGSGSAGAGTYRSSPVQVGSLTDWKQISSGYDHTMAIKTDGSLWGWSYNADGRVGDGTSVTKSSPVQIGLLTDWVQVSAGASHSIAVKKNGTVWAWGYNADGRIGDGTRTTKYSPVQIGTVTKWSLVGGNYSSSYAVRTDGTLYAWGDGTSGQLGRGSTTSVSSPVQIGSLTNWAYIAPSKGSLFIGVMKEESTKYVNVKTTPPGLPKQIISTDDIIDTKWQVVSDKPVTTRAWTCGYNNYGQLGLGTSGAGTSTFTQVGSTPNSWAMIDMGTYHSAAVKQDGTLWTWGFNNTGQLGDGTRTNRSSPIQIGALTDWAYVACSYYTTLAIKQDGTLWAWGDNYYGQHGKGNSGAGTNVSSPIQVGSYTDWSHISAQGHSSIALKTDGTAWAWGRNEQSQLGLGIASNVSTPTKITNKLWKEVNLGKGQCGLIGQDGTLWMCGYNNYGQLGDGTTGNKSYLSQVGSLTNWKHISTGYYFASAIKNDGTLWSWGYNWTGQLGDGTVNAYSSPTQIGSLTDWKTVECGLYHVISTKKDKTVWGWGYNLQGQLGDGTTIPKSSPVQIGSFTDWAYITCQGHSSLAITIDPAGTVSSVDVSGGTTGLTTTSGPITTSGTITLGGTLSPSNGGTGLTNIGSGLQVLRTNITQTNLEWADPQGVTSIDVSGGTTGLTLSGGPITTSGTLTLSGTLGIANGGTGQTDASGAINALLPIQATNAGKFLTTNGVVSNWANVTGRINTVAYSPSVLLDWTNYDVIRITLTGNIIITNQVASYDGQRCILEITQDGVGSRTISFTSETIQGTDITYIPSTAPNKTDIIGLSYHQPSGKFRIIAVARGY